MDKRRLIVIGGGAAGFFCAVNAARLYPHLQVTIIEKSSKLLSKVKVSGGGRCNVTHDCNSISEMIKKYPRGTTFLKKAFHHFFTKDTIAWFNERGVQLKTEDDGRMFPVTNDSQTIIDCLLKEANKYNVEILMNAEVVAIDNRQSGMGNPESLIGNDQTSNGQQVTNKESQLTNTSFEVLLKSNKKLSADFICVACGGYPKTSQFEWLTKIGHTIEEPVPSLFTFNIPKNKITELMGVTIENVLVKIAGTKLQQSGPILITHWGLSGPAILKLSAWGAIELAEKKYECIAVVNWIPEYNENSLRDKIQELRFNLASQKIYNRNPFGLAARLWEYFLNECAINENLRWADLPAKEQNKLIKILCAQEFAVNGKTTFKEEFVTAGGIKLDEIDVNTMQSKKIPRLYFAGEIINVDGITGGFNFQNAWTTGWIAANGIK